MKKIRSEARRLLSQTDNNTLALSRFLGKLNDNAGTLVLQGPPGTPERDAREGRTRLPDLNPPKRRLQSRTNVVGNTPQIVEWAELCLPTPNSDNRDGCLHDWMGSSQPGKTDGGPVVPGREGDAYQWSRAPWSYSSGEMLSQGVQQPGYLAQNEQHVCHLLHKQIGGMVSPQLNQLTRDLWLWCMNRSITLRTSKEAQRNSQRGFTPNEGEIRLEAMPKSLSKDRQATWPTPSGSVCLQTIQPASTLHEPETRTRGDRMQCIQHGLVTTAGICESFMVSDRKSPSTSQISRGPIDSNNPIVESPTMVPHSPEHAVRHTPPPPEQEGTLPADTLVQQARCPPTTSCVDNLRERYRSQRLSGEASKLLLASWRQKSSKSYDSLLTKWASWCDKRNCDPFLGDVSEVVNFLAQLFEQGYQYRSLSAYRSAISSVHDKVDGVNIGQHPLVAQVLQGAFNELPPQPRYSQTWDVHKVTSYINNMGDNAQLKLRDLTLKLTMLLALTRQSRSSDLTSLDVRFRRYSSEGVTFQPTKLAKQSGPTKDVTDFCFARFPHNPKLCPVHTLQAYEVVTQGIRDDNKVTKLLLATIRPHKAVTSSTIAKWLKVIMERAGINTSIFKAHSVRSASVSTAAIAGITTADILEAADWTNQSVLQNFITNH